MKFAKIILALGFFCFSVGAQAEIGQFCIMDEDCTGYTGVPESCVSGMCMGDFARVNKMATQKTMPFYDCRDLVWDSCPDGDCCRSDDDDHPQNDCDPNKGCL